MWNTFLKAGCTAESNSARVRFSSAVQPRKSTGDMKLGCHASPFPLCPGNVASCCMLRLPLAVVALGSCAFHPRRKCCHSQHSVPLRNYILAFHHSLRLEENEKSDFTSLHCFKIIIVHHRLLSIFKKFSPQKGKSFSHGNLSSLSI